MSAKKIDKKKKKLKRQLKKIKARSKPGQAKLLKKFEGSGNKIVVEPSGAVKMSDVIQDFAEPLLMESVTDDEVKDATKFSILVWNASLAPLPERENLIETLTKQLSYSDDPDHYESVKSNIDMLLKRKEEMFPNVNRIILDCQFSGSGKNLRLDVVSNL